MATMKLKTNRAARKRFTVSARGKVKRRRVGQSHFNARATGKETRRKHSSLDVHASDKNRLERLLPHA